ncbi:FAD-binding Berberine family protein [Artemisia annua]|uniref:FAD-binding Berberine family protein n=1 Tax=Artemisia annua TaxID=35608 RepID=A0A2U1MBD9_ARTAN|nr:FAD-binding Berberine family protein [Artemisia annua]
MKIQTPFYLLNLIVVVIILLVLRAGQFLSANTDDDFFQCLLLKSDNATLISQVVYSPNNISYTSVLQFSINNLRFTSPSTQKPRYIVTPVDESQIQTVVYCSKKHGLEIRMRSGGHDFEGLSYVSQVPFVILDLINLRSITVDTQTATAWVQAGATLGELYYAIAQKSQHLGFPGGVWYALGLGGHVSGGGYGAMMRKYGLAADNVVDAQFINVHGRILDRKSMGEDLFWDIRGGGGSSFGIILSLKIKLVPVPETVTVFSIDRTLEQNLTKIIHKWQQVAPKIDNDLDIRVLMFSIVNPSTGNRTIRATFDTLFLGGINRLLPLMQEEFPELGLTKEDCTEMSWIESVVVGSSFTDGEPAEVLLNRTAMPKNSFKGKSDFATHPISEDGFEGIWKFYNDKIEAGMALLVLTPYGGKMDEIPESAIPFPNRLGTLYMIEYLVVWDGDETSPHISWIRNLYTYMASYVSNSPRTSYLNYDDLDLGVGKTYQEASSTWGVNYFKNNFDRLVKVKTMVDPGNFFKREQSIPTKS